MVFDAVFALQILSCGFMLYNFTCICFINLTLAALMKQEIHLQYCKLLIALLLLLLLLLHTDLVKNYQSKSIPVRLLIFIVQCK